MKDQEKYELLKRSVEEWNEQRANVIDFVDLEWRGTDMSNAELSGMNLEGANLSVIYLSDSNLSGSNLKSAYLDDAVLTNADLTSANLRKASLCGADLSGARLSQASFHGADMNHATFKSADLSSAKMPDTNLRDCIFQSAKFDNTNLQRSDFRDCDLEGTLFTNSDLEGADLRGASGFILNSTNIRDTRFSSQSLDPWSTLRRKYTGPAMIWTMLALLGACLPYLVKVLYWSAINLSQTISYSDSAPSSSNTESERLCGGANCIDYDVWELVLGFDKGAAYWIIPVTLIVYNILRGLLTYKVGPMREEEERSGYSPEWRGKYIWQGYHPLFRVHKVVSVLFWIATATFLFNAYYWLNKVVWVPVNN